MNTKDLSPAFITSLVAIFIAALMIGATSTVLTVLGWLLLLIALGLNVFASMVSIQRAKGGPLPAMITEQQRPAGSRRVAHEAHESEEESKEEYAYEPEEDTEAQPVVSSVAASSAESEEKIFRNRAPRPRNR